MKSRGIICAVLALFVFNFISATSSIEVRMSQAQFVESTSELTVKLEIKVLNNESLNLASQNYRIYYDSKALGLNLNHSALDLPSNLYGNMEVIDHFEDIDARAVSKLSYDAQIGFINFNVNLKDHLKGGVVIDDDQEWTSIARLSFQVKDKDAIALASWARHGLTEEYASAFVQVSEWVGPSDIETVNIERYHDLVFQTSDKLSEETSTITIGPNPSVDFIKLESNSMLPAGGEVVISEVSGKVLKTIQIDGKSKDIIINTQEFVAGMKLVALYDGNQRTLFHQKIVVSK